MIGSRTDERKETMRHTQRNPQAFQLRIPHGPRESRWTAGDGVGDTSFVLGTEIERR